jgi:3-oxoacyl-[acyl-carrier-protein] synthase-3
MKLSDVDTVIFHQPFDMLYDHWIEGAAKAGLSKEKWIHTWDKYGNLSNSVIPVNLAEFWEEGKLKKNSIIVLLTLGAGFHMPTMITRWLA